MTSGIDELEAFIAALRLSFLTSSSSIDSHESLRHGITAFRETLTPRNTLEARLASGYAWKKDDSSNDGGDVVGEPEEPRSATPTVWSSDDRIDMASQLTKQIELVSIEVREGTRQTRELLQNMKELRTEVQEVRSALAASKAVVGSESYSPLPTLSRAASETTAHEAQVDPSPKQRSGKAPGSLLSTTARSQSISAGGRGESVSNPPPSFVAPEAPLAAKLPAPPHGPSQPSSSVAVSAPVHTQIAVPVAANRFSTPVFLAPPNVPGIEQPKAGDFIRETPTVEPPERTSRPVPRQAKKKQDAKADPQALVPNDEGKTDANYAKDSRISKVTQSASKSPRIATAVDAFSTLNEGELEFEEYDKIVVLDSPNTPVGWMYGEVIEKRRGIFPGVQGKSSDGCASENSEATDSNSESSVIVTALKSFIGYRPNDLALSPGDKVAILNGPDTPVGWMYGEKVKKRRGIFPAQYVKIDEN
ncbi:hypothetical protein FS837_006818 [Tulasnella sp. UAMH 9824]|nr:hypothetical protein FS837_006818 [Tulasnella sp. UAMH 9824]